MRSLLMLVFVMAFGVLVAQQRLHPVHVNQKWGLMNATGQLVVEPSYNNIGLFQKEGYVIVEKEGLLGVLDTVGRIVIPCKYTLMDCIGRGLFSVKEANIWKVINTEDKVILNNMAGKLEFLVNNYVSYEEITGFGLAHIDSGVVLPPEFKEFMFLPNDLIVAVDENDFLSLYNKAGQQVLKNGYDSIRVANNWIWAKRSGKWGAYDLAGKLVLKHNWKSYKLLGINFLHLIDLNDKSTLYSIQLNTFILNEIPLLEAFDDNHVEFVRRDQTRGLINLNGQVLFEDDYEFITRFGQNTFRVKKDGYQGIINNDGTVLVNFIYDYIGNLNSTVTICRRAKKYGILSRTGKLVLPMAFSSNLELNNNQARHKDKDGTLQLFDFDENGELVNNSKFSNVKSLKIRTSSQNSSSNRLRPANNRNNPVANPNQISDSLAWLFHAGSRKWGLWHIQEKRYKFPPKWNNVQVLKEQGITIVGELRSRIGGQLNTGRLRLKINQVFGIFANVHGLPVTKMELLDVRVSDFQVLGLNIARCIFIGGKHGLLANNGKILTRGFSYIGEFIEGKARVTRKGRLLVDLEKKVNRPLAKASSFFNSLLSRYSFDNDDDPKFFEQFKKDGRLYCEEAQWGFIDTLGQLNSKFKYDYVSNYSNGRAMIRKDGQWGMLDAEGNEVLAPAYDNLNFLPNANKKLFFIARNQQLYGAIDSNAKIAVPVQYAQVRTYHNDRIAVKNTAGRWGFVDRNAKEIINTQYRVVKDFSEGLAIIYDQSRWGAVDLLGNVIIKPIYLRMGNFSEGKAWVHLPKGQKGYIDKKGKLLFSGKYSRLMDFKNGVARIFVRKKGWGLIDTKGNYILKPKRSFKKIEVFNKYGIAKVKIGKRYRLINQEGKFIGKRSYGTIKAFKEGLAVVRLQTVGRQLGKANLKWTFIDTTGMLVTKKQFRELKAFSEGRAGFRGENAKRGYINKRGDVIIEPTYFKVEAFKNNRAVVWDSYNRTGVIDTTGTVIIPVEYNKIVAINKGLALVRKNSWNYYFVHEDMKRHTPNNFAKAHVFESTATAVKSNGKWGVINEKGLQILIPKYAKIEPFKNGAAKVSVTTLRGVVDLDGNVIIEPKYEYIHYVGEGLFRVERGDRMGYLNMKGEWVWEMR